MGRNFRGVHIGDVVQSAAAPLALARLPALVAGFTGRDAELTQITALVMERTVWGGPRWGTGADDMPLACLSAYGWLYADRC